jgi:hypothetical protein
VWFHEKRGHDDVLYTAFLPDFNDYVYYPDDDPYQHRNIQFLNNKTGVC